jgi:hypothetical protein
VAAIAAPGGFALARVLWARLCPAAAARVTASRPKRNALAALSDGLQAGSHVTIDVTNASAETTHELQVVENMVDVAGIEPATSCLQSKLKNAMWFYRLAFTYVM